MQVQAIEGLHSVLASCVDRYDPMVSLVLVIFKIQHCRGGNLLWSDLLHPVQFIGN